ncbi:unnamed protein product [Gordionus sp. m RMFG-2023]|uniref:sulfotransferase 1A1-like isoform X2 n=1 Tax=Gordionus sp. m RMFG-2023 TaxID=3053472 RepID=UPI0030E06121
MKTSKINGVGVNSNINCDNMCNLKTPVTANHISNVISKTECSKLNGLHLSLKNANNKNEDYLAFNGSKNHTGERDNLYSMNGTNDEDEETDDKLFDNRYTNDINVLLRGESDNIFKNYIQAIPKIQMYKGILLQGFLVPQKLIKGLEGLQIRPDDIIIASYPKSGTTWTEEIVSILYNNGNLEKIKSKNLIDRVIHLEVGRPLFPLTFLNNLKSPRLLATHLPFHLLPAQVRDLKCKIIYVARNPKDNAVSYFHHHKIASFLGNYKGSWDEFLHLFSHGKLVYGSWFHHVAKYWEESINNPDKILFLKYEDMKRDLEKEVRKILGFLNMEITPERLNLLIDHCSFESMKNNNMVNREVLPIKVFDFSHTKFMRKGIIGDWKNYFDETQNVEFERIYQQKMKKIKNNLTFDFEP